MLEHARALVAGDRWHTIGIDRSLIAVLSLAGRVDRLRKLAEQCSDADVRDQLSVMANEWLERAKAAESPGKPDLPDIT